MGTHSQESVIQMGNMVFSRKRDNSCDVMLSVAKHLHHSESDPHLHCNKRSAAQVSGERARARLPLAPLGDYSRNDMVGRNDMGNEEGVV